MLASSFSVVRMEMSNELYDMNLAQQQEEDERELLLSYHYLIIISSSLAPGKNSCFYPSKVYNTQYTQSFLIIYK
jgi:hypothetical protein